MDMVNDRCQSQFTSMNRSSVFWDYVYNFNCSSPESYLIPGLPPDTEKCLQADDVCEFIVRAHTCMIASFPASPPHARALKREEKGGESLEYFITWVT